MAKFRQIWSHCSDGPPQERLTRQTSFERSFPLSVGRRNHETNKTNEGAHCSNVPRYGADVIDV